MNEQSKLIDKVVEFSVTKDICIKGYVLDKIEMKDKPDKDNFTVTGFMIEDGTGKVHSIAYWRILKVCGDLSLADLQGMAIPKGDLKGGYNRDKREQN